MYLRAIREFTGVRITGCPWRALDNPTVHEIAALHSHYETGNLSAFLNRDDPEITWQGLELYIAISNRVRFKQFEEEQQKLKESRRV